MWLSLLQLVNFRNLRRVSLELESGLALVCGPNGQGKTNLLEAAYVLATTRSPRTSVERELLSWQTAEDAALAAVVPPFARLEGRVQRAEGEVHLELTFEAERPGPTEVMGGSLARGIKVNGLPTRAAGLIGQLPVVYFSPEDVALAGGPPAGRRQYLNVANSQVSGAYLRALQRYNRVLLQRNQVLRQVRDRRQPSAAVDPWTEQLIEYGAAVLLQRLQMLDALNERIAQVYGELAGAREALRIVYRSTAGDGSAACFRTYQQHVAAREVDQAATLVGPHRDDFSFDLDGIDLNTYGSRGQQRLAVLSLKLAEADWMRAEIGQSPVLLLDDVLSELDPARRGYVVHRVGQPGLNEQVWITATDLESFAPALLWAGQRFEIDAGQVRPA
jgi:DNA replication and repair protein RecF